MAARLVVLGWDSATFDVADPLLEAGRLPVLRSLQERGWRAPLRSTWPAMTDCAWTCAFTGLNPGAHGIFGSWYRAPGDYRCLYFSSRDRAAPALWEMTNGVRHLVWNVPMSYPPNDVEGIMVAGYGAPPGSNFCRPSDFQSRLAGRGPLEDLLDRAPHSTLREFLEDLLRGLAAQAETLPWAIDQADADCVVAVWPHIDRAQHFFWRFRGTEHPLGDAVDRVYEAMDRATGVIAEAFPEADLLVVSDHGAGPLKGDVNLGSWLVENGYAGYGSWQRSSLAGMAWKLPPSLRKLGRRVAPGLARSTMAATLTGQLGHFDWSQTRAFHGLHSDVWLNLRGREQQGTVDPSEAQALLEELQQGLAAITDPSTGERVFAGVHTRDELYSGPQAAMGPDLMLDPWSSGYRVAPGHRGSNDIVVDPVPLAGVDEPWSADHRPLGVFVGAGPRIGRGRSDELNLYDVAPTALALLEQPVPEGLDGRVLLEALVPQWLQRHPVKMVGPSTPRSSGGEYSDDEAAAVAAHLKDLGYIE